VTSVPKLVILSLFVAPAGLAAQPAQANLRARPAAPARDALSAAESSVAKTGSGRPVTASAVSTAACGCALAAAEHRPAAQHTVRQTARGVAHPVPVPTPAIVPAATVTSSVLLQTPGEEPRSAGALLATATREYRTTGRARPVQIGTVVAYPYGVTDPVLTCAALRACVIDLEPGERLVAPPIVGDKVRWHIGTAPSGPDSANTFVWVKPTDCDLSTNLVLSTDRRVYQVTLEAPTCDRQSTNPRFAGVTHLTFYFPDESVPGALRRTTVASADDVGPNGVASGAEPTGVVRAALTRGGLAVPQVIAPARPALAGIIVDITRANFDYRITRDKRFPWAPAQVFDDGAHAFIKIPPEAAAHEAPALFELRDGGDKALMNYVVRDGFYVTDRTFRRAALVLGQGKQEQRVTLDNPHFGVVAPVGAGAGTATQPGAPGGRQP
jgi:type IV secretory pathway VirB9-like protein